MSGKPMTQKRLDEIKNHYDLFRTANYTDEMAGELIGEVERLRAALKRIKGLTIQVAQVVDNALEGGE